ncbi:hypothetical protein AEAC466_20190 [Asticcacaulis sp. AC466]|uniref:hypothetical protein n=1 Tax=Asticcacaulis sp. AC466 TaxID=1282362 RepID=UPI0003C40318|nr:hypothetical protein [Asticcacaulis sp. AC466]ESQ81744.1 hypothetical protein AEAC466_20190 [Asticcacaulis sp. AC466]
MTLSHKKWLLALVPLCIGLAQCDVVEAIHNPQPKDGPYAYDLILKTSPKAEAALKTAEYLQADAYYYGIPKPGFTGEVDPAHRVYIGQERWNFSAKLRRVHLYADAVDPNKLPDGVDGEPMVLVTVVGTGAPEKSVTCHQYLGSVRAAHEHSPEMHCELEGENYWDGLAANSAASSADQ